MTRKRRSFTPEFKQETACLVLDQGYAIPEASRSLDVGENVLRRWGQPLKDEAGNVLLQKQQARVLRDGFSKEQCQLTDLCYCP